MNTQVAAQTGKQLSPIEHFRINLDKMKPQFAMLLPAEKVDRFVRTCMTALQREPKLVRCTMQSFLTACMRACEDDLLPDGRQGAIVPFGEQDGRKAADTAQWMPMIAGLRIKVRRSGEIADWYAELVYQGDEFDYVKGDDPHLYHKPQLDGGSERKITHAYSICKFKDGTISREVMTIRQLEEIREDYSKSKKGPWNTRVGYGEMCKKTVARRHSKTLPMTTDLDLLFSRDDVFHDLEGTKERKEVTKRQPASAMAALEKWAGSREDNPHPPEPEQEDAGDPRPGDDTVLDHDPQTGEASQDAPDLTMGELIGMAQKHPPKTPDTFKLLARQIILAAQHAGETAALANWWSGPNARAMRNGAQMTAEDTAEMSTEISAACEPT